MTRYSRRSLLAVALVTPFVLAGCGGEKKSSLNPPDIKYNVDISEMGMFVVDPRYTAAYLPEKGDWILFDDLGELFRYRVTRFPDNVAQVIWVNDYHDKKWLKAEDAWYLQTTELHTPMGWGLAAFRNEDQARQLHTELGGEILTWSDILARPWDAPPAPDSHGGHTATPAATPASGSHGGHTAPATPTP